MLFHTRSLHKLACIPILEQDNKSNKNMKKVKLIIVLSFLLVRFITSAQITVYRTYEDFQNKTGEEYDDYLGYSHSIGTVKLILKKDDKKIKIHCRDLWGLNYKDAFFRIDKKYNQPTRIISSGKIVYYENGIAHLSMIRDNSESGKFSIGYFCYVSKSIDSELIPMPGELISDARKKIKKFKEENPEYKELFDCIEKNYNYINVRPCIVEFEKSE